MRIRKDGVDRRRRALSLALSVLPAFGLLGIRVG